MVERTVHLARERQKLEWLRRKFLEQEAFVRSLEARAADAIDEAFEREVLATTGTPHADDSAQPVGVVAIALDVAPREAAAPVPDPSPRDSDQFLDDFWLRTPKKIPSNWVQLFKFIGEGGKSYKQLLPFMAAADLKITPDAVRTGLMNYRRNFGMIENPSKGFYVVTPRGMSIIAKQEGERGATANDAPSKSQINPVNRGAAVSV